MHSLCNIFNQQKIITANVPVISIGNISFGGTGKTPFVIYISCLLKEFGYNPAVIGRGYKRKSKNDIMVSDGNQILVDATTGGDEMVLIAQKTKVPVFAGKSKSKLVAKMNANDEIINYSLKFNCIIVDDGFQHKKLHRNLDIVLVDKNSISKNILKRERIKSLERANLIVCSNELTKEELINSCNIKFKKIITAKKINAIPYNLFSSVKYDSFEKKVIVLVGIANPYRFLNNLKYDIINVLKYTDHHYYTKNDIQKIIKECNKNKCNLIVTTEKDAVKLRIYKDIFTQHNINIIVFPIEVQIENDDKNILAELLIDAMKNINFI